MNYLPENICPAERFACARCGAIVVDRDLHNEFHGIESPQEARNLLEQYGLPVAQGMSAGDVVELANFIADAHAYRAQPLLVEHVRAFAPTSVNSGEMTPTAERVLLRILSSYGAKQ